MRPVDRDEVEFWTVLVKFSFAKFSGGNGKQERLFDAGCHASVRDELLDAHQTVFLHRVEADENELGVVLGRIAGIDEEIATELGSA